MLGYITTCYYYTYEYCTLSGSNWPSKHLTWKVSQSTKQVTDSELHTAIEYSFNVSISVYTLRVYSLDGSELSCGNSSLDNKTIVLIIYSNCVEIKDDE